MKIGLIGFGQAGGKIADQLVEYSVRTDSDVIVDAIAVNTAKSDLLGLDKIPEEKRVLIGQDRVKGHGVGADNELGSEIAEQDMQEIQNAIDSFSTHEIEAFLIVSALGGGTGSGGSPVLAKHLQRIYEEPVYGVGVLPSNSEGSIYSLNAARSFQTFVEEVDSLITFDNETWKQSGESVGQGYDKMNDELIKRVGLLLSAGQVRDSDDYVGESVVDSSEIINTLGTRGVASIGYASEEVETKEKGLLARFKSSDDDGIEDGAKTNRMSSLARKAALSRLTLDCSLDSVERALVMFAGPPEQLSRKGIERSRKWIEEETGSMEVRGGDYPLPGSDKVACVILFSGVTDAKRIKEMQKIAIEAQDNIENIENDSEDNLDELLRTEELSDDEQDDLDPLF